MNNTCRKNDYCGTCKLQTHSFFMSSIPLLETIPNLLEKKYKMNIPNIIKTIIKKYKITKPCYMTYCSAIYLDIKDELDEYVNYKSCEVVIMNLLYSYFGSPEEDNELCKIVTNIVNDKNNKKVIDEYESTLPKTISSTEKNQLIKARIGHEIFKKNLLELDCKCRICGAKNKLFLIASHIKRWEDSPNEERLDKFNGLALCPNHDFLIDKGYISFTDEGNILISRYLDKNTMKLFNINPDIKINLYPQNIKYIKYHRENYFKG